jgi:hypothetical protein
MANISTRSARQRPAARVYQPGQSLCLIVGLACLFGFLANVIVLALPPELFNVQWRIALLQQVGDRSIVLLFSIALLMYGFLSHQTFRKPLALISLAAGVMFTISGMVMVHDSLKLQDMAINRIATQENQLREQIQTARENPAALSADITPEMLEQATQQLGEQVETAKQSTKTGLLKTGAGSFSSLIITGIALIAIGRFGIRAAG